MRIDRVRLQLIRLPLREPFRISSGTTRERRILLVRLGADGVEGVGECVAGEAPFYSAETVHTARYVIERHLAPALLGKPLESPDRVGAILARAAKGHRMAKGALEMAAWDAVARAEGVSLAGALGGARPRVPAGVSIGIQDDVRALIDRVSGFVDEGYRRVKLKVAPDRDLEIVQVVRTRFPHIALTVDANAAYGRRDLDRLRALEDFELDFIEQPFPEDALLLHADLQARLETPICLDESITSPDRCRDALGVAACRVINIKPGRLAGHGPSRIVHDLCAEAGVPVWCGGMLESGIGRAHNVALASLPNMRLPGDTSASGRYWVRDVVDPPFALNADGTVDVPTGPGIGVEIDEDFLSAITEETVELTAGD
ncbi:MAG: o-succinylbenzoate synthase [Candidatus Longimicrobiales bacterium M2_2A_002]